MPLSVEIEKSPRISLKARRTLDGSVMIFDHEDIDIVLSGDGTKCISFPKHKLSDKVYQAQDRMFEYLIKRGIIENASVRGGNVHGSLEGKISESKIPGVDALQACLYILSEYLNQERPYFKSAAEFEDDRLDYLLNPSDENSTELGDVAQSNRKGSMHPGIRPFGFQYNYSLIRENAKKKEEEG
jgi:hypothetical protein